MRRARVRRSRGEHHRTGRRLGQLLRSRQAPDVIGRFRRELSGQRPECRSDKPRRNTLRHKKRHRQLVPCREQLQQATKKSLNKNGLNIAQPNGALVSQFAHLLRTHFFEFLQGTVLGGGRNKCAKSALGLFSTCERHGERRAREGRFDACLLAGLFSSLAFESV
jgi:hypothetical protein